LSYIKNKGLGFTQNYTTATSQQGFPDSWGRRGHDHMVVGFTTACAIRAYHH